MIPNNQFWFRQTGTSWPPIETGYEYVAEWMNLSPAFTERDGDVIFETGGKLRMVGGWNPALFPPDDTTNQQWESADGITWVQIADAPWTPRHNFANGFRTNGEFWLWGGDGSTIPTGQRDVWKCVSGTWSQVTADWGNVAGNRISHSFCVHKNYLYLIGGSILDCVRSTDGITWTKMSDLPAGLSAGYSNGYACSHRGEIFILGGEGTGGQNKVYKSSDDGGTWIALPDLANDGWNVSNGLNNTSFWCRLISWNTKLFYASGASDGGNTHGMWYSEDGALTWNKMYSYPVRQRHAQGYNTFGDDLYIVAGNNAADSNRVYKTPIVEISNKAIYSTRKANPSYSGPCMRVRYIFGGEFDIGFVGNDIDEAAIITAAGGLNCTVVTWYDQSGNGHDVTQSDSAKQPFIYLSAGGGVQKLNGKVCINFNNNTQGFEPAADVECTSKYVIYSVCSVSADSRTILGKGPDFEDYGISVGIATTSIGHRAQNPDTKYYLAYINTATAVDTQYLIQVHRNRMSGKHCINGGALTVVTSGTFERYDTDFSFNRIGREGVSFTGKMQEIGVKVGFHDFDLDTAIKADVNGYFGIY